MELVLVILVNEWLAVVAGCDHHRRVMGTRAITEESNIATSICAKSKHSDAPCDGTRAQKSSAMGTANFAASTRHPESFAVSEIGASIDSQSKPMQKLKSATGTQLAKRWHQFSTSESAR